MTQMTQNVKKWAATHRETLLWLAFVLLTLPHFNPLNNFSPATEKLINILRVLSSVVIVVWVVFIKRRLSPIVLLLGVQQSYLLLVTIWRGAAVRDAVINAAAIVCVALLYDMMQEERKIFLSSQIFCFELMIYCNLVTVLLFPHGMYAVSKNIAGYADHRYYFLGFYNNFICYCVPALLLLSLWKASTKLQKLRKVLLVAVIYATAFKLRSGAVLVALIAMAIACVFLQKLPSIFNFFSVWLLHICFFVGIIWLRLQNLFRWLIDDILGEWNSFMGRMDVWDKSMEAISHAWLFGHGQVDNLIRQEELGYYWANHAHNMLLELLYKGGIINAALFILIIFVAGHRAYKYRYTAESKLIAIAVFGWCIDSLVETYMHAFLMAMFVIAYYSNRDDLQPGEKDPLDIPKWDEWLRAAPGRLRARFARR